MTTVLLVRATTGSEEGTVVGYYGERRRREGEEFELEDPSHFSHRWMEAVDWEPAPPTRPVLPPPGADTAMLVSEKYSFRQENEEAPAPRRKRRSEIQATG